MEVKPGYKQTEVGVIPEDWDVKPLRMLLSKGRLGGNYPNQDTETEFPLMKMGNIARGYFDMSKIEYISQKVTPEDQHLLVYGDVLFNTRNTLELVGKVAIWRKELAVAYYNSNLMRLEFNPAYISSNEFANYTLNNASAVIRLRALATGTTSVAAIYTRDLMELQLALPSLAEQRAIAEALSDVDALLDGLDRLIAKKRDLKQAAMQQLLTGKTRLPGFSGEWEVRKLGEIVLLKNGYAFKSVTYTSFGSYKIITIANVQNGYLATDLCNAISSLPADLQPHQQLKRGDILISMTGNVGRVCRVDEDLCLLNQRVGKLVPIDIEENLLFILLSQPSFISSMTGVAKGGAQPNLSASDIIEHKFLIPKDSAEQSAIAAALSGMDAELAALEARRNKTRDLKQAMMQELLTGRTRLVKPEGSHG